MRKRLTFVMVALAAVAAQGAGQNNQDRVTFEAAKKVESVDGDLKAAIELYLKVSASNDQSLARQAHLRMAAIYRKLGDAESQTRHELLARGDVAQGGAATNAQSRASSSDAPVSSLVLMDQRIDPAHLVFITPDGRFLSMPARSTEIVIRNMSTGQEERLGAGKADAAMVSPDGRRVALVHRTDSGDYEVQVQERRPNSTPSVILDSSGGTPYLAAWSKDSSSIMLTRIKQDRTWEIGMLSVADRRFNQLVSLGWRHLGDRPSLSPDGRYIAYSALANAPGKPVFQGDRPTPPDSGDQSIYVVAVDGSGEEEVVKGASINESPVWTEDGSHILFLSDRAGTFGLYAVAMQNGAARGKPSPVKGAQIKERITPIGVTKDGAFYYAKGSAGRDVFQENMGPDGKVQGPSTRISDNFVNQTSSPAYSPNGDRVAFVRRLTRTSTVLVVQDLASGREKTYQMLNKHVWMPDGRRLLGQVTEMREGGRREVITLLDLETGELTPVLSATANAFSGPLSVSPDGNTTYVVADLSDSRRIVAIDLNTRQQRDVWMAPQETRLIGLALSPDGRTLAMTSGKWLARVNVDGTGYKELVSASSVLAWRLDGRAILCQDDRLRVMWIPATGGDPQFTGLTLDMRPSVNGIHLVSLRPPMGSQIAFINLSPGELWKLEKLSSVLTD